LLVPILNDFTLSYLSYSYASGPGVIIDIVFSRRGTILNPPSVLNKDGISYCPGPT